jgi:hypothetical protein
LLASTRIIPLVRSYFPARIPWFFSGKINR